MMALATATIVHRFPLLLMMMIAMTLGGTMMSKEMLAVG
jgi:hypothetical protein